MPPRSREVATAATLGTDSDEKLWAAVGEPNRRLLLDLLLAQGEATPTMLAAEVPFTRQAVSKHLAVLERAGLVVGHRSGREVRFTVRTDRLDKAAHTMAQVARHWDARLNAIKRLAEAAYRNEEMGKAPPGKG